MAILSEAVDIADLDPTARGAVLLGRNWRWLLARGVLALLLAGVAFLFPIDTVFAFTLVFAVFAGADGIISLIGGVAGAAARDERWETLALRGLLGIAVALLFAIMPVVATLSYALVSASLLAAWAVVAGVLEIAAAIRLRKAITGEWLLGLSGALSVILGLFLWMTFWTYPLASLFSMGWMVAAWALFSGIALIALALRLRRLGVR